MVQVSATSTISLQFKLNALDHFIILSIETVEALRIFMRNFILSDLQDINWDIERNTNVNTAYANINNKLIEVVNKHAPAKQRKILAQQTPYMNKQLKSAVYKKRMLYNKLKKINTNKNWEAYRTQRNLVTKLKKRPINNYFIERCTGGPKAKDVWPTVKTFSN